MDIRIGSKFLHAGPRFGGYCLPKDARALIKTHRIMTRLLRILDVVSSVKDVRKRAMTRKVAAPFGGKLRGSTIAVLGLTFEPNTDDMREAPSIPLSRRCSIWGRPRGPEFGCKIHGTAHNAGTSSAPV